MVYTFSLAAKKIIEQVEGKEELFVREFVKDLSVALIKNTPVDTGRMISAWWPSVNVPLDGPEVKLPDANKTGAPSIARAATVSKEIAVGQTYYIINSQRYAKWVEHGTTTIKPRLFARRIVAMAPSIASTTAAKIRGLK